MRHVEGSVTEGTYKHIVRMRHGDGIMDEA
jgi:hypothetical protein